MEDFIDWCKKKGMSFDGIEIRKASEDSGYGVFATRNFRPEEKLIVIPEEFMLSGGKVANMEGYSDIVDRAKPRLTPFEILTIFFAVEDPDKSEWGPYLRILPKSFTTPDFLGIQFTPDDVPLSARDNLIKHQEEISGNISKIRSILPEISNDRLLWAWNIVNTRCVYNENPLHPKLDNTDGDTVIVAPLIDMLNHSNASQCIFLIDKRNRNYIVKANATVMQGYEALVTYGPHPNAKLWFCYGFRLDDNIHNKIVIPNDLLFELARKIGLDITEAHENAVYSENFPNTIYASDEGILSWQFQTNMKILFLSKEEVLNYKPYVFSNIDDEDPLLTHKILTASIRILESLRDQLKTQKKSAAQTVHWIWNEEIALITTTIERTRVTLQENEEDISKNEL